MMDLRTDGIRVLGKGDAESLYPLPRRVLRDLRRYALRGEGHGHSPTDRIFPISARAIELSIKRYAKREKIEDWERVTPHRLRAFFATNCKDRGFEAFMIRDLMRHRNLTTTNTYVGTATPHALQMAMERLAK